MASVAQNVNKSYNTYFKHPDAGRPRTASPFRNRTIEVSEPATQHLKAKKNGWATIQIKGLPVIKFRTDKRLPENEQPMVIRITLKPRRLDVSLTYQSEPKGIGKPTKESVGIDPGVKQSRNYSEVPARQHQPGRVVGKNNGPRWNFQAPTKPDSPVKSRGGTPNAQARLHDSIEANNPSVRAGHDQESELVGSPYADWICSGTSSNHGPVQ